MGVQAPSVYQQIIEKTKGIHFKTQMLAGNIEKKLSSDKGGYDSYGVCIFKNTAIKKGSQR